MKTTDSETIRQILSFRSFILGIILGVIVYLAIVIISGLDALLNNIFKVNPFVIVLAMLLSLTNYFCRFLKWHLFTRSLKLKIPLKENFEIFFAGLSLAITPAKIGEAIRAFLLQKTCSTDLSKGLASTFSERLIDLLAVTILAIIGIFIVGSSQTIDYLSLLFIILLGILGGVLIFLFDPLYNLFSWIFHLKPLERVGGKIDKFRSDVIVTFHYSAFLGALCLGIIGWACEGLSFFLIAQNLGVSITLEASIFIYATSSLLGALSFLPGGLGVMEGSMEIFLASILAIPTALAGALIILIRMTTLWFGVTLGLIFLLLVTNQLEKNSVSSLEKV